MVLLFSKIEKNIKFLIQSFRLGKAKSKAKAKAKGKAKAGVGGARKKARND